MKEIFEGNSGEISRIVILGHTGFIGSHLMKTFVSQLPNVETIGLASSCHDLTKESDVEAISNYFDMGTLVVMCAGIKKQYGDSIDTFSKNLKMATNLCRVLDRKPVRRFIFFSTADVYGEDVNNMGITEETPVNPVSYYGMAKYTSECLFRKTKKQESSLLILRPPLVYGPGDPGKIYGPVGFIKAAVNNEPITIWGDGAELRESVFIEDLADIVRQLAFCDYDGVVNTVSGQSHTFRDMLEMISGMVPYKLQIASRPRTKKKVDNVYYNKLLLTLLPDFTFTSLEEGIRQTFDAERQRKGKF